MECVEKVYYLVSIKMRAIMSEEYKNTSSLYRCLLKWNVDIQNVVL